MNMNYAASVVFAVLAFVLLFAVAWGEHNTFAMRLCIVAAGAAWFSCFTGYIHDEALGVGVGYVSLFATFVAVILYVWAFTTLRS